MAQLVIGLILIVAASVMAFYGQQIARDGWAIMYPPSTDSAETQAAQVSGWATVAKHGSPNQPNQITYEIKIKNSSAQPIYEVKAALYIDKTEKRGPVDFHIVPAGETVTATMVTSWPTNTVKGLAGYIDYEFRDSRGENWHRDFNGNLISIK